MSEANKAKKSGLDIVIKVKRPPFAEYAFALRQLSLLVLAGHALDDAVRLLERNASHYLRSALALLRKGTNRSQFSGHRCGDLLGDYLRDYLTRESDPKIRSHALQSVGQFLQRVGEQVERRHELVRTVTRPVWLFGLSFIALAPVVVPLLEDKIYPVLESSGCLFPTSTQIIIAFSNFYGSYPWPSLLIMVLFAFALRWIWFRGWLPGSRKQLLTTRSILLGEALLTMADIEGNDAVDAEKLARLLPRITELIPLRRSLQASSADLLLSDALQRTRSIPGELIAAVQSGIDSDDLRSSLKSFLALQNSRQRLVEINVRRIGHLTFLSAVLLLFVCYFVTIDLSLMQALFANHR